jgi:excisionase family DNA binding protein
MSQIPGFYTLGEAARQIGVSHSQAARYVRGGLLKYRQVGNQYLIPVEETAAFDRPDKGNPLFRTNKNPAIKASKKKNRKSS